MSGAAFEHAAEMLLTGKSTGAADIVERPVCSHKKPACMEHAQINQIVGKGHTDDLAKDLLEEGGGKLGHLADVFEINFLREIFL